MNYKQFEQETAPRIGAQFFVNPDDSIEDTQKHFQIMHDYGIRLVRLFVLWDHIEPKRGMFSFERYDAIYDLAQQYDIKIVATITAEDPPTWFQAKPFYHHYCNLNDKKLKKAAERYIKALVSHYADHPAQYAWILMNEPEVYVNFEPSTMRAFAEWLRKKYTTIEALNQKWYKHFRRFEDVCINAQDVGEYWQCFYAYTDWLGFLKDNLVSQLSFIRDEVKKYDQKSLLHINPKGFFGNLAPVGQDYWKENAVCDVLGASIHPAWKFTWFKRQDYGYAFSFCTDLIRSAAEENPFWVTELQSGATLMTGIQPCTPTPRELTAWLWDGFGSGAKAIVYWMWHPRTFGQEAGEWGIVTANHRVSKRLEASAEVSRLIAKHESLFANARPIKPTVAILYNHGTEVLSLIEGSPLYRSPEAPIQAFVGVYKALLSAGIAVDFISEEQIANGKLLDYRYLYAPYSYALDSTVQQQICDFIHSGGRLWAEAPFAWKNPAGEVLREIPISAALGFSFNEFLGCRCDLDPALSPYLCTADIAVKTAAVVSEFEDGTPQMLTNQYGSGKVCFANTAASLGFFETQSDVLKHLIADFAADAAQREFAISHTGEGLLSRVLLSGEKRILILENWGAAQNITIAREGFAFSTVCSLYEKTAFTLDSAGVSLSLSQNETAVLILS